MSGGIAWTRRRALGGGATVQRQGLGNWRVEGELSFETVPALTEGAAQMFAAGEGLDVDLGGVERADSAGVALLVEWMNEARRRELAIRFLNMPPQMLALARVSSLDRVLPLARA